MTAVESSSAAFRGAQPGQHGVDSKTLEDIAPRAIQVQVQQLGPTHGAQVLLEVGSGDAAYPDFVVDADVGGRLGRGRSAQGKPLTVRGHVGTFRPKGVGVKQGERPVERGRSTGRLTGWLGCVRPPREEALSPPHAAMVRRGWARR